MQMSDNEIVNSYREAMNKQEHIIILSIMNGCLRSTIIQILNKNGIKAAPVPESTANNAEQNKNERESVVKYVMEECRAHGKKPSLAYISRRANLSEYYVKKTAEYRDCFCG